MLRMSYSTVCLLLWFALPGEPWGTSGKADSQRSPSSALWTLDSLCLETSTAWEIENNSRTSVEIMRIYCRYCKSSGHNYMFISHFKTVGNFSTPGSQLRWTHTATWSYREREAQINLYKFLLSHVWLLYERKYLCGSAAHLVLGPGDGVYGNRPPQ